MGKVSKNLSLDEDAVKRGERYSRKHGTNVSRLVSEFLRQLPIDDTAPDLSPAVQRLLGSAAGAGKRPDRDAYHEHLWSRLGGRGKPRRRRQP